MRVHDVVEVHVDAVVNCGDDTTSFSRLHSVSVQANPAVHEYMQACGVFTQLHERWKSVLCLRSRLELWTQRNCNVSLHVFQNMGALLSCSMLVVTLVPKPSWHS